MKRGWKYGTVAIVKEIDLDILALRGSKVKVTRGRRGLVEMDKIRVGRKAGRKEGTIAQCGCIHNALDAVKDVSCKDRES